MQISILYKRIFFSRLFGTNKINLPYTFITNVFVRKNLMMHSNVDGMTYSHQNKTLDFYPVFLVVLGCG